MGDRASTAVPRPQAGEQVSGPGGARATMMGLLHRGPLPVAMIQESGERVAASVERVIVGKHREVRLALVALLCQGHLLIEDVPGTGKTMLARALARSLSCTLPTHPVHAGPAAQRRHRALDLQPEEPGVRVPPGSHRQPGRPRRRDQPGHAQDAVGAAGGHGGAAHDRGRHDPAPAAPLHGHRHAEPHRVRGHLPAAGGPARPLHAAAAHGLPGAHGRDAHPRRAEARPPGGDAGAGGRRRPRCWPCSRPSARSTWTPPSPTTSCGW